MESKTKNKKTRLEIERMAIRAFDGLGLASGNDAIREMKEGWFNAAYSVTLADGREVVLKIAPPLEAEVMQYEKNIMITEVAMMRLVYEHPDIPVPAIYGYDESLTLCDAPYFFMEKMGGDNLEHVRAGFSAETQSTLDQQIGAIIRAINTFPGSYFGYPGNPDLRDDNWRTAFHKIVESVLEDAARKNVVFEFSYDELRGAFQKHAHTLDEVTTPCLVHWDAWNPNFFVQDERITGIIDFERALWAEPLMEAQFKTMPNRPIDNFMHGYGMQAFTDNELTRCYLYDLHLALVMQVECYYRTYDSDDIFNFARAYIRATMEWLQAN